MAAVLLGPPRKVNQHGKPRSVRRQQRRRSQEGPDRREGPYCSGSNEDPKEKAAGDELSPKAEDIFRVVLQNAGGLPAYSSMRGENQQFKEAFHLSQADVYAVTETNRHWRNLDEDDKLHARMRPWFQSLHMSLAYNTTERPKNITQYGGVGLFSLDKASHRANSKGSDPSGLGRWSWTKYQGKGGLSLQVVVAYCPHTKGGDLSVYGQHRHWYHKTGSPRIPRQAFWEDLLAALQQWIHNGDQLIVMGNWNQEIQQIETKYMAPIGLREVLYKRHGKGPATFEYGSDSIDGIFMTRSLQITQGGYLPFDHLLKSDHRALWADVSFVNAFGIKMLPIEHALARRLNCKDPPVMNKWI